VPENRGNASGKADEMPTIFPILGRPSQYRSSHAADAWHARFGDLRLYEH
jgi:hypothetical protein